MGVDIRERSPLNNSKSIYKDAEYLINEMNLKMGISHAVDKTRM